jgi:hypothetical protein
MESDYTLEQIENTVDKYVQTWTRTELEVFVYDHLVDSLLRADDEEVHEFMTDPEITKEEHPHG